MSLDSALASSQQAREALELQLKEHALETHRVRIGLDEELRRLTAQLSQAGETQERMRREHAEAMAARDQDLRQAEERHSGQERRMLAEVDRARQTAKALESKLAREQQRRTKSEEAAAKRLEAELEKLHQVRETARQAEAGLREHWPPKASSWRRRVRRPKRSLQASKRSSAGPTMKKPRTRRRDRCWPRL